ncbi:MAG: hypothetical protein JEY99_03930 [Spirochaetales bacterium]|nr:hypothetical protein [Spirochaetales bacterium]
MICFLLSPFGSVWGQSAVTFSGEVKSSLDGIFSGDDFDSVLNPSNYLGFGDLASSQSAVFKLEGANLDADFGGANDGFRLWASLKSYPVGAALMGLASSIPVPPASESDWDPVANPFLVVSELNTLLGDNILSLDLMRLSYTWSPGSFSLTLGRQSFLTGYGYGWNPMDLVSPLKDPADPEADKRGVDGASISWDSGYPLSVKLYGLYNGDGTGVDAWEELKGGGEINLLLPVAEVKASVLWGRDMDTATGNPNGAGVGFLVDLMGAGLYGEGAVRQYARRSDPGVSGSGESVLYTLESGEEWVFSALGGIEYYLPAGTALIFEYFYNGEGFDQPDRTVYKDALESYGATGTIPSAWSSLYRPGYLAKQYVLVNILHSFWDPFQVDLSLTALGSPDSGALSGIGSLTLYPSGSLSFSLGYAGLFSFDDEKYNEAWLSPVQHIISLSAAYGF